MAGDEEGARLLQEVKRQWERRPEGKRESWGKILSGAERGEIGDPFGCDWGLLFKKVAPESGVKEGISSIEEIREKAKAAMGEDVKRLHFLLSPDYAKQLLTRKSPLNPSADLANALIPIRLHFLHKGNVSYRARIYRLPNPPEECQRWTSLLDKDASKPAKKEYPVCPGEKDLLGFVTSGNVSLSEGRGRAVGALSWEKVDVEEDRWADKKKFHRWCIVRDVGMDIARLARWELNE
jgi:ribonuclease P/MRP protein subunit POP1